MNKNDLINKVSDDTGLSKTDSTKAVDSVFDSITSELKSGGDIRLIGFGTFLVTKEKQQLDVTHKLVLLFKYLQLMFQSSEQAKALKETVKLSYFKTTSIFNDVVL